MTKLQSRELLLIDIASWIGHSEGKGDISFQNQQQLVDMVEEIYEEIVAGDDYYMDVIKNKIDNLDMAV